MTNERPPALAPVFDAMPQELVDLPQWVIWRYDWRVDASKQDGGEWAKVLYSPRTRSRADSTDPATWATFGEAGLAYRRGGFAGVGFVFADGGGITGVDFDDCVDPDTGEVAPEVAALIERYGTYTEISPSGTGLKLVGFGSKPGPKCRKVCSWGGDCEIYDKERFFTLTGNVFAGHDSLVGIQDVLTNHYKELFPDRPSAPKMATGATSLSDSALLDRMFAAKNGEKIKAVWYGDASRYRGDESRRDQALMNHLAWWTNGDRAQMERMFGASECGKRDKWVEREDYRERTIERSLDNFSGGYDPNHGRTPSEVRERVEAMKEAERAAAGIVPGSAVFLKSDTGNADRFVHRYGAKMRYDHSRKCWFIWTGKKWREDKNGQTQEWAKETVRAIYTEAASLDDDEQRAALATWARQSDRAQRIAAMMALATSDRAVALENDDWDKDPFLLNCLNGTIDLRTGRLRPHDECDLITKICPVEFDPAATAPLWKQCLQRWQPDPEVRRFLQRSVGYTLTGHTGEETAFFCYGGGRNGKSKFTGAIETILGDYAARIPIEVLMDSRKAGNATPELIPVIGARLVLASEISEAKRLNEAFVKDATGGDRITARAMYAGIITFKPQFKLWLYGNHKPTLRGNDEGIKSRLPLIPWTVTIPAEERDTHLAEKLMRELPGILAWAVRGCLNWQKDRLSPPEAVIQATEEYHSTQDVFGQFLSECCALGSGQQFWVKSADLRRAYDQWVEDRGDKFTLNGNQFADRLQQAGAVSERRNVGRLKVRVWQGIALLATDTADDEAVSSPQNSDSREYGDTGDTGDGGFSNSPHVQNKSKVTQNGVPTVPGVPNHENNGRIKWREVVLQGEKFWQAVATVGGKEYEAVGETREAALSNLTKHGRRYASPISDGILAAISTESDPFS